MRFLLVFNKVWEVIDTKEFTEKGHKVVGESKDREAMAGLRDTLNKNESECTEMELNQAYEDYKREEEELQIAYG